MTYLIQLLFAATVLLIASTIVCALFRRASLRHRVWTFGMLGLLMLPVLLLVLPTMYVAPVIKPTTVSLIQNVDRNESPTTSVIVLEQGTRLFGSVTRSDGATMDNLLFEVREIHDVSGTKIRRSPVLSRFPAPPRLSRPYEILLPPGQFEFRVRNDFSLMDTMSEERPWERNRRVFEFTKTLIIDGTQDEIELDIVLEEVGNRE